MRILVTGSKGVVGQKLVKELNQRGHSVFGVDLLHHTGEVGFIRKMSNENWKYARCDIEEYRQIERVILDLVLLIWFIIVPLNLVDGMERITMNKCGRAI